MSDHARENAIAAVQNIVEMVAALECDYDRLKELRERFPKGEAIEAEDEDDAAELAELEDAAGECESLDDAQQRISEDPLGIEVRSGWCSVGDEMVAEEFCILLTTGGPALRIRGELNDHKEPTRAWVEYQDWGTPWTELIHDNSADVLTYCQQFYFGE